ncbi:hypothetical protein LMG28727_02933 [Paraburkholderia kirstenboschensis]|nr:hypothetical protein [Paraburkholderia kirstenboschensis]CAD6532415.1 hypothetical protein LMG28727_02933 [Paraburkholderia kirstenboschensis]
MTMDEFESHMLKEVMEMDALVAAWGESMAGGIGKLEAASSRLRMQIAEIRVEIEQIKLMVVEWQRELADRDAEGSGEP